MYASNAIRTALRARIPARAVARPVFPVAQLARTQMRFYSGHHEETFEEFTARYVRAN